MTLTVAVQMDPIQQHQDHGRLRPLRCCSRRSGGGIGCCTTRRTACTLRDGQVIGHGRSPSRCATWRAITSPWARPERVDLADGRRGALRQDPPFDWPTSPTTHLLERIHPKTLVVNDPTHVRNAPEKIFVTQFPHLMPPTLISPRQGGDRGVPARARRSGDEAALRQWRRRGVQGLGARIRISARSSTCSRQPVPRALGDPALPAEDHRRRQAHHPHRRRGGGRHQPRAGGQRHPLQHGARRRRKTHRPHAARARDLRDHRPGSEGAWARSSWAST